MVPLLFCSLLSLTVIIERMIFWTMVGMRANQQLVNDVMELCRAGDWEGVRQTASGSKVM
jgi:biopolymer transport protein ExbB